MGIKPPPSTFVLLIRHAKTATTGTVLPGRAPGLHLSPDGRQQAEALAERLRPLTRIAAVYASPLARARETAAPLARVHRLTVLPEGGLNECDYGRWTGAPLNALRKRPEWRVVQRYPSGFRFPGGESFMEMQARITAALGRLIGQHRGKIIVAVSHADPIKVALAHALGTHLDLFQRIAVAPASVTAIAYREEGPVVLTVNATHSGLAGLIRP